jgi:hypothetical protein
MADNTDKVEGSVDGKFFVDSNCIDCDLCRQTAPENFERNEDEGFLCQQAARGRRRRAGLHRRHGRMPH